ncbi:hypothetical protein [uncultured Cetobacterium sp.]|uniref:hypothetical protein n=1 Tax=uncultured Cetobacterium sp. TaxID=527638 RepID=UPI00262887F3|nr:hypothetical protein [uncultured Cetobacterium sp.]
MDSRYEQIEVHEYESSDRTSIKILNHDGSEYMTFSHNEIKSLKMNLKTGIFYFIGNIFGAPKELKLNDWKRDRNDIIKKIIIEIVKNGLAKRYAFHCGIQTLQEDYKTMSYLAVFRHDNIELPMFHTVKMFDNELVLDIKIDKSNISFKNITKGTAINLGLNGIGLGLGIVGAVTGTITIPVVIALGIGASSYGSATYDFIAEVTGEPELKGQGDLLQQLSGEIGKILENRFNNSNNNLEKTFESTYSYFTFIYGTVVGTKSAMEVFKLKNFTGISKNYENGYIGMKKIILKSSTNATQFESAIRKFNKSLFINDTTNTISAGKSIYDKIPNR